MTDDDIVFYDGHSIDEARNLRDRFLSKLIGKDTVVETALTIPPTGFALAKLIRTPHPDGSFLRYDGHPSRFKGVKASTLNLLRMLNGTHGMTIYKVLLIKKGSSHGVDG